MEAILEIIMEGILELIESPKIPIIIRLLLVTIVLGPFILLCVNITIGKNSGLIGAVISSIIAVGLTILWMFSCHRIIRSAKKK